MKNVCIFAEQNRNVQQININIMTKFILKIEFNSQKSYVTRIDNNVLSQTSNTYSSGVIEYDSESEAKTQSENLILSNGKKVKGVSVIEVK